MAELAVLKREQDYLPRHLGVHDANVVCIQRYLGIESSYIFLDGFIEFAFEDS